MNREKPIDPRPIEAPAYRRSPHYLAALAALFTLPLLFVGGSVTTYRVGLAVPDWPTTFGMNMFLYDFFNAPFGVKLEHTHRLYGAAVGMATIGLMAWLFLFERRGWVKGLGALALVLVVTQGILGGTRVTQVSTLLAAVHGCTGQAFFGLMVALAVVTGRDWLEGRPPVVDRWRLRPRSRAMLALVSAQIAAGAWLRHFGTIESLAVHGLIALAVLGHATWIGVVAYRAKADLPELAWPARGLVLAVWMQVALGIAALIYLLPFGGVPRPVTFYEALIRTGHQTNAALLLAATVVLALRATRHLEGAAVAPEARIPHPTTAGTKPAANLEALA
ncbi:Cytochrome oxidase assembly protein [Aquisphaera giovannonii]|uniref:Cytochrome oxidase assembly protein n=1 Tax=Aquisphaera giovannonii TaxID=406548 RepID=A0A5B9W1D3_9BACT|nr:COX15/CtaA family protein [Aquisphaera giovannonii]QEH34067.1 Cytochrome oxidase assembly protein [Aquisphaera giovannonii]